MESAKEEITERFAGPKGWWGRTLLGKICEVIAEHHRDRRRYLHHRRRMPRVVAKWNAEALTLYEEELELLGCEAGGEAAQVCFLKWNHFLWQEIVMWSRLGGEVSLEEFRDMCRRRGFSTAQRSYLIEMLEFMDLKGWTEQ